MVSQPTRGNHLLDLVLTDMEELSQSRVQYQISDHNLVRSFLHLHLPDAEVRERQVYDYRLANWSQIRKVFADQD